MIVFLSFTDPRYLLKKYKAYFSGHSQIAKYTTTRILKIFYDKNIMQNKSSRNIEIVKKICKDYTS